MQQNQKSETQNQQQSNQKSQSKSQPEKQAEHKPQSQKLYEKLILQEPTKNQQRQEDQQKEKQDDSNKEENQGNKETKETKKPYVAKYKLGYWAVRGKAERIRILLEYLQVPYQEVRYTLLSKSQWYNQTKLELVKKNPNISLPFLIDGDEVICESEAIMVHICYRQNRTDLLGRNGVEKIKMATAIGIFHKLQYDFEQLCYGFYDQQNKSFQYAREEAEQFKFKPKIKMLTEIIQNNDFFCGMDSITYIDFIIADFLEILFFLCSRLKDDNIILNYYQRQFWKIPQLAAYAKSGRFFRRPYNEPHAVWR